MIRFTNLVQPCTEGKDGDDGKTDPEMKTVTWFESGQMTAILFFILIPLLLSSPSWWCWFSFQGYHFTSYRSVSRSVFRSVLIVREKRRGGLDLLIQFDEPGTRTVTLRQWVVSLYPREEKEFLDKETPFGIVEKLGHNQKRMTKVRKYQSIKT